MRMARGEKQACPEADAYKKHILRGKEGRVVCRNLNGAVDRAKNGDLCMEELYRAFGAAGSAFSEENRTRFSELLKEIRSRLACGSADPRYFYKIIEEIGCLDKTPYLHFFSDGLYEICMKVLTRSTKQDSQTRISAYSFLFRNYDLSVLFGDVVLIYNDIDNFHIQNVLFKNYMLHKILRALFHGRPDAADSTVFLPEEDPQTENAGDRAAVWSNLLSLSAYLENCPGFVEYLIRNPSELVCRGFMLLYTYRWLGGIKVDLLKIKNASGIKDVESKVICRIFTVFRDMRRSGACGHGEGGPAGELERSMLRFLFKKEDARCIMASVYKRLFFYFLCQNRKAFQSVRILRVFDKAEIRRIYKGIRSYRASFVNIFSQLDRRYLIRELVRTLDRQVFESIVPDTLSPADLAAYYESYFRIVERNRTESLQMGLFELRVFSRVFNSQVDRSFVGHLRIKDSLRGDCYAGRDMLDGSVLFGSFVPPGNAVLIDLEASKTLACYASHFGDVFVDTVFLCSLLLDHPQDLLHQRNVSYFNNIMATLNSIAGKISIPLRNRLLPVLRRLLCYDAYVLRAGILCRSLYGGLPGGSSLAVLAALGDPAFPEAFASEHASPQRAASLLFYAHHCLAFAASHSDILLSVLAGDDPAVLLRLLESLDLDSSAEAAPLFSFVGDNIGVFYGLLEVSEHRSLVVSIFIRQLAAKAVLPCMVVPHIICSCDCDYVFRNCADTVVNCIPDALCLMARRIRGRLDDVCEGGGCDPAENTRMLAKDTLRAIVEDELKTPFVYDACRRVGARRIVSRLSCGDDILVIFIVVRQMRNMARDDRELFFKSLEESTHEEHILEMLHRSREFYRKTGRGVVPVEYMLLQTELPF